MIKSYPHIIFILFGGVIFTTFFLVQSAQAQTDPALYEYPRNHLPWFTIESDHFLVHYQQGSSRSAQVASVVAEEIYEPVTSLYEHQPEKKVSIVLRDREDYSNGAAYFFDDKIEIWVPALDTPLRGTHHWMRNVITHEFIHIVQLQASMKRSKSIPSIYLQWLSYEDVRRPDVLYGFPNGILTYPFATVSVPAWFAEGSAQYQLEGLEFDFWDSHRDMILRSLLLSNSELGFVEMGHFSSKTSLEREIIYNQGFAFTAFLVHKFGESILAELSKTSAETGKNDFNQIIKLTTGQSGIELFNEWLSYQRNTYREQAEFIEETNHTVIESEGFFNFYPQYSPNQKQFAYLTNRGRDFSRTRLILRDQNGDQTVDDLEEGSASPNDRDLHHSLSNNSLDYISNRFSFSPDSREIAYSRIKKNSVGELYQDLFIYNIEEKEKKQITQSSRLQDPSWHPSENQIAAVQQKDGTQNVVLVHPETSDIQTLTSFSSGETIYTPVWHPDGNEIYFSSASLGSRNIYRITVNEPKQPEPVLENYYTDYRDPWIDPNGDYLYYSSDETGIFNIYRQEIATNSHTQITNVLGGAFMPFVKSDSLYFSTYTEKGYKIARTSRYGIRSTSFNSVSSNISNTASGEYAYLHNLDFSDIGNLSEFDNNHESPVEFHINTNTDNTQRTWSPYSETVTEFSVFPVIRFDNYTKLNGSNSRLLGRGKLGLIGENLWRDLKLGAYFSTRDVTENISIFGGALFGPGSVSSSGIGDFFSPSRINELDRDLFLTFEHRGLPFIKKSWSPTVTIELYNLKRNVEDGLSIEEFPCTSCLPETRYTDIRYAVWEAAIFFRSKLNYWSLIELGASYSPYNIAVDGFFSQEYQDFIPGSTSEYFRGSTYSGAYVANLTQPTRHSDIAPIGLKGRFTYRFQPGRLLNEYEINDGVLRPVYQTEKNHSLEWITRYGFPLTGDTTGMLTTRAFAYLNSPEDSFYLDYAGGLVGMQSYPFFALGGTKTAFVRASFLTPIIQNIHKQAGPYSLDKLFGHLFVEAGNGWGSTFGIGDHLKYGVGAELRFAFNSYYLFPLKFFVNSTYGFNRLNVRLENDFVTTTGRDSIEYGKEFLFLFGLTFDFDML